MHKVKPHGLSLLEYVKLRRLTQDNFLQVDAKRELAELVKKKLIRVGGTKKIPLFFPINRISANDPFCFRSKRDRAGEVGDPWGHLRAFVRWS